MIEVTWPDGARMRFPALWLRDNCGCDDCRVAQTGEKRFHLSSVPADLQPAAMQVQTGADKKDETLLLTWPDGHRSRYPRAELDAWAQPAAAALRREWPPAFTPRRFNYGAFLKNDAIALRAIEHFLADGAILLEDAPTRPLALEELAPRLGPVREMLFARIHDVRVDPAGYNIAHTSLPLPPHNDFASYAWPPSVQALHMLRNEASGGESIIVDGWALLEDLRAAQPEHFNILQRFPVPFREYDEGIETFAAAPIIQCCPAGRIERFRYSNQLMQAVNPLHPEAPAFYAAYHALSERVMARAHWRTFRMAAGEMLILAAHRVLHGRDAFQPDGPRHLQDAYFEHDNVRNQATVLRRALGLPEQPAPPPLSSMPAASDRSVSP